MRKRKKKKYIWVIILLFFVLMGSVLFCFSSFFKEKKSVNHDVVEKENEDLKDVLNDKEKAPSSYLEFMDLKDGEYLTEKGNVLKIRDGIAYIDDMIIVNKTFALPSDYVPVDSYQTVSGDKCNQCIDKDAMEAFLLMRSDAISLGLNIYISSGYRSYSYQEKLYNNYVSVSGKEKADTYSARPGHSEHQTGTCFDLNTIDDSFADTDEGKWVNENAYLYGFIIRYPKGKESITGYQYESWHLRYVGKELASLLYHDGNWETLEEYYGISSSYE